MTDVDHERAHTLDAESWAFALQIYARPGIPESCLRLQAEAGVDVMILLISAFAAAKLQVLLKASDIAEMDEACRPWREQIVQPLRAIRVTLKSGPSPAPDGATDRLRAQVKAGELAAERIQNKILSGCLLKKTPAPEPVTCEDIRMVLRGVVTFGMERDGDLNASAPLALVDAIVDASQAF